MTIKSIKLIRVINGKRCTMYRVHSLILIGPMRTLQDSPVQFTLNQKKREFIPDEQFSTRILITPCAIQDFFFFCPKLLRLDNVKQFLFILYYPENNKHSRPSQINILSLHSTPSRFWAKKVLHLLSLLTNHFYNLFTYIILAGCARSFLSIII